MRFDASRTSGVLARIAATALSQLDQFLPDQWKALQATTTPAN